MASHILVAVTAGWVGAAAATAQCPPQWSPLGVGVVSKVEGIAAFQPPGGPTRLFVTGAFWEAGGQPIKAAAYWDGTAWADARHGADWEGTTPEFAFNQQLVGQVPTGVYVAGQLPPEPMPPTGNVTHLNNGTWASLGQGVTSAVYYDFVDALEMYDEDAEGPNEPYLYAGGRFAVAGGLPCNGFARWDGSKWWPPPEQPERNAPPGNWPNIYALEVFDDDGSGPRRPGLYIGGFFDRVGALASKDIARWDGQAWEGLGVGVNSSVWSLCTFDDDGPGPRPEALYVSGSFNSPAPKFARWDGQAWSAPPSLNSNARAMLVWDDDGPGPNRPALYATGFFTPGVAKWRGQGFGWEALEGPLSGGVGASVGFALGAWDEDGPGPNPGGLYVGGNFRQAGSVPANFIARWGCPLPPGGPCYPDCNGDSALNLADFGCFQTKFALGDGYAECNGDGVRNLADFGCFVTKFALGCP